MLGSKKFTAAQDLLLISDFRSVAAGLNLDKLYSLDYFAKNVHENCVQVFKGKVGSLFHSCLSFVLLQQVK